MTADAGGGAGERPPGAFLRRCERLDAALANAETTLLAILILGSLAASLLQIALRNLGLPPLPATDTAVRRALLWIAFLGASLAAFRGSHLAVDIAEQVLPPYANRMVDAAANLIAAGVTALLTVAAARFAAAELAFTGPAGAAAAVVMPLGFVVITLRFLLAAARRLTGRDRIAPPEPPFGTRRHAGGGT
jgi:TRAP-type C4-dicarboxylate transport system permease small subunit